MRYANIPEDLRDAVDDLLGSPDFRGVLEALDGAIAAGAEKERRRIAGLVALRSEFEDTPARDATIDRAIVDGGSAETTAPLLDALGVSRAEVGYVDDRTRWFDRALVAGVEPEEMAE